MTSTDALDCKNTALFATFQYVDSGEGSDLVVVEKPVYFYGKITAKDRANHRYGVAEVGGLFTEIEVSYFGSNWKGVLLSVVFVFSLNKRTWFGYLLTFSRDANKVVEKISAVSKTHEL